MRLVNLYDAAFLAGYVFRTSTLYLKNAVIDLDEYALIVPEAGVEYEYLTYFTAAEMWTKCDCRVISNNGENIHRRRL